MKGLPAIIPKHWLQLHW